MFFFVICSSECMNALEDLQVLDYISSFRVCVHMRVVVHFPGNVLVVGVCTFSVVCTCSGCAHARGGSGARGMRAAGWRIDPRGERGRLLIAELADGAASLAVQDCAVCRGHTTVLCVTCDLCHLIIVCPCLAPPRDQGPAATRWIVCGR